jgi:hypothetical protein
MEQMQFNLLHHSHTKVTWKYGLTGFKELISVIKGINNYVNSKY